MTEAQYKNWKRVQKSGLAHYLIWHISLWGGIPAGIIFAILDFLYSTDDHKDKIMRFNSALFKMEKIRRRVSKENR